MVCDGIRRRAVEWSHVHTRLPSSRSTFKRVYRDCCVGKILNIQIGRWDDARLAYMQREKIFPPLPIFLNVIDRLCDPRTLEHDSTRHGQEKEIRKFFDSLIVVS